MNVNNWYTNFIVILWNVWYYTILLCHGSQCESHTKYMTLSVNRLMLAWYVSFNILSVKCCLPYMKDPFEKGRPIKQ